MGAQNNRVVDGLWPLSVWGRILCLLSFFAIVSPRAALCQTGREEAKPGQSSTADAGTADGALPPKEQLPATPPETDSGHEAKPATSRDQPLLDDVRASSFQKVTPGTTAESDLEPELGKPLSRRQEGDETIYQFRVGPFPQIEVVVRSGVVVRVIVNMPRPVPLDQVTQELRLGDFSPVAITDEMGQPLAIAYPERGVMLMLAPNASSQTVPQLVLEAISAEPFWRRAESDTTQAWEKQLLDLDYAVKLDPGCAEAHWRKAEILLAAGQFEEASASVERAVKLEPETACLSANAGPDPARDRTGSRCGGGNPACCQGCWRVTLRAGIRLSPTGDSPHDASQIAGRRSTQTPS